MQSTKPKIESHPIPTQLATKTDLSKEETRAITDAVNPLVADAFALYVKTKNFHWHLYGSHFNDYHELFDEHAEAILESIDIMAERVRRVGGTTIRSIGHIGQLQTIKDDNSTLVLPGEMVRILMEDNGHIAKMIRDAITVCDKNRDPTSYKTFWIRQSAANGSFTKWCRDQRILNNSIGGWSYYWRAATIFSFANHSRENTRSYLSLNLQEFRIRRE